MRTRGGTRTRSLGDKFKSHQKFIFLHFFFGSQEQLTPPAHHKTSQTTTLVSRRKSQLWKWHGAWSPVKGRWAPWVDIQDLGWFGSPLTSVTTLSWIPSVPPQRLHSRESHPHGHGWLDPGCPRDSAISGSLQSERNPRCIQEVNSRENNATIRMTESGKHILCAQEFLEEYVRHVLWELSTFPVAQTSPHPLWHHLQPPRTYSTYHTT